MYSNGGARVGFTGVRLKRFEEENMREIIAAIALTFALVPLAHAGESVGDKLDEAKTDAVEAKREAGRDIRRGGRELKSAGREVRQKLITRCADGRHTAKGARGCRNHGGVRDPK